MLVNFIILLPFAAALFSMLLPKTSLKIVSIVVSLILLSMSLFSYTAYAADPNNTLLRSNIRWISSLNANWYVSLDGMSLFLVLLCTIVSPLIFMTLRKESEFKNEFFVLMWAMIGAMLGVFTAKDGLLFYVFWELALIPIYFICLLWGGLNKEKITFKFFIYTLFGSLFMLAGFLYLYSQADSWNINALYEAGRNMTSYEQNLVFWAIFIGFAIKMPIFPFHTWQPDTYSTSPTQGTMLLSGIMLKMGTYGTIRWLLPMVPAGVAMNSKYAIILSIIGIVYASCIALAQKDIKRLMAWSSIAHVGLISSGIFVYNEESIKGAFVQMLAHGINVVGLFFIADIIFDRLRTRDLTHMGGIRGVAPKLALLFLIVVLGSIALPLTNGFVGEFLLLNGVFQYNFWAAFFAGLTVILGAVYMLRAYQQSMLGETNAATISFKDLYPWEKLVLIIISALIFFFGLFPNVLFQIISPMVESLLNNNL